MIKCLIQKIKYYRCLSKWLYVANYVCPAGNPCRGYECKCYANGDCAILMLYEELKQRGKNNDETI